MQLYRSDREGRKHGGCALYVRNDLTSQLVSTHSNRSCDTLIVKIKSLNLIVIVNYRPPDAKESEFKEQIDSFAANKVKGNKIPKQVRQLMKRKKKV